MKPAIKELVQLLQSSSVLITYKKAPNNILNEKYFIKADNDFCNEEDCTLHLISCAEDQRELIHETQICGYRIFEEGHDFSRVRTPQQIKEDFQLYKSKAAFFKDFEDFYFNPNVDHQQLKVCVILEMSSLEELNDNSPEALQKLKGFWKKQIDLHKQQTNEHINAELLNNSMFDRETVEEIRQLVLEYDPTEELSQIQTKQELFEFWPTLLLPAPDFINEIFVDLFRFSDT